MLRTKRQIESEDFKRFRQGVPDFPPGEVLHKDSPDFRVFADGRMIGIEHRRLFTSDGDAQSPAQKIESNKDEVCALAQELAELRGLPSLIVTIFFGFISPLNREERLKLAREIVACVSKRLPTVGEHTVIGFGGMHNILPHGIERIHAWQSDGVPPHRWREADSGIVLKDGRSVIQSAIDAKAKRINDYLVEVDECWLLLVANDLKPSGLIHPDESTLATTYHSPFFRTYFMNGMSPAPLRLSTKPSPLSSPMKETAASPTHW